MIARNALILSSACCLLAARADGQGVAGSTAEATALAAVKRGIAEHVINPFDSSRVGVRRAVVFKIADLDSAAQARVTEPLLAIWPGRAASGAFDEQYHVTITPAFVRGDTASIGLVMSRYLVKSCQGLSASITYHFLIRKGVLVPFTPPGWVRPPLTASIC